MLLGNHKLVVPFGNEALPDQFSVKDIVKMATSLAPDEQQKLLNMIKFLPSDEKAERSLRVYLRLALKDEPSWLRAVQEIKRNGLPNAIQSELGEVLFQFSESFKSELVKEINFNYLAAIESKNRDPRSPRGSNAIYNVSTDAKRGYDFILRYLYRDELQLEKELKSGSSPSTALSEFFKRSRSHVKSLGANPFDAPAVLEAAQKTSELLAANSSNEVVYVSGSVMTARFSGWYSDIDLLMRNGLGYDDPLRWKIENIFKEFFSGETTRIPKLEWTQGYSETALSTMSALAPVILKISAQGVSVLIYPPQPDAVRAWTSEKSIDSYEKPAEFKVIP